MSHDPDFSVTKKRKRYHFRPVSGPKMASTAHPPQEPGAWSLLSLVDELLLCIIDQIDAHETLCNLAATNSRFQALVEPYCWRSLLVRKGRHASRIALGLNNRVERIAFVQDLAIRYNDKHEEGIENLGGFMEHMHKLRSLTIESPCPNNGEYRGGQRFESWTRIDYTTLFERGGLPVLTSCTYLLNIIPHDLYYVLWLT
jgi:hypothetical protein